MKDIEGKALDGEDARTEAAPIVARFSTAPVNTFVSSGPVLRSECWERALKLYPTKSMKGNIDAIAKVAIEFLGDVPVTMITKRKQEGFFAWMARLPKSQGRSHGKNRFTEKARSEGRPVKERRQLTKQDEINIADAADEPQPKRSVRRRTSATSRSARSSSRSWCLG